MKNPTDKRTKAYKEWKTLEEAREQELKDFKNLQPKKVKMGLGDDIETITEKTGIKKVVEALTDDCGCDERKKRLNKFKLPTRAKAKRCLDDKQREWFKNYMTRRTLKGWNVKDIQMLIDLYAHVFALQYNASSLCVNCVGSGRILKKIDEHLEIVYNESI